MHFNASTFYSNFFAFILAVVHKMHFLVLSGQICIKFAKWCMNMPYVPSKGDLWDEFSEQH